MSEPPLVLAIRRTIWAVQHRKVGLRWLVGAYLAILLGVPLMAVTIDWSVLSTVLLLLPLWCAYLLRDALVLRGWRQRILAAWLSGDINLDVLSQAFGTLPILPAGTIDAMMMTLPTVEAGRDGTLSPAQRESLATESNLSWAQGTASTLFPCSAAALAALCLLAVLVVPEVRPSVVLLAGAILVTGVWICQRVLVVSYGSRLRRHRSRDLPALRQP